MNESLKKKSGGIADEIPEGICREVPEEILGKSLEESCEESFNEFLEKSLNQIRENQLRIPWRDPGKNQRRHPARSSQTIPGSPRGLPEGIFHEHLEIFGEISEGILLEASKASM